LQLFLLFILDLSFSKRHKKYSLRSKFKIKTKFIPNIGVLAHAVAYGEDNINDHLETYATREINNNEFRLVVGVHKLMPNILFVLFRGTANLSNAQTDMNYSPYPCPESWGWGCQLHSGFWTAYLSLKQIKKNDYEVSSSDYILDLINDVASQQYNKRPKQPITDVYFLGHSLGGAIANLAALEYIMRVKKNDINVKVSLVTFGSPRVGNKVFAQIMNGIGFARQFRVIYGQDPVTGVPPKMIQGHEFMHSGTEIKFPENNFDNAFIGGYNVDNCADLGGEFWYGVFNPSHHTMYKKLNPFNLWQYIGGQSPQGVNQSKSDFSDFSQIKRKYMRRRK
jgi:hypothetical protein